MAYRVITQSSRSDEEGKFISARPAFGAESLAPRTRGPPLRPKDLGPIVQLPDGNFQFSGLANSGRMPDSDRLPPPPPMGLHPPHEVGGPLGPMFPARGFGRGSPLDRGHGPEWGRDWRGRDEFLRDAPYGPPVRHFGGESFDGPFLGGRAEGFGHRGEADRFVNFRSPSDNQFGGHSCRHELPPDRSVDRGRSASSERGRFDRPGIGGDFTRQVLDGPTRSPSIPRSGSAEERKTPRERGEHAADRGRTEGTLQGGPWRDGKDATEKRRGFGCGEGVKPAGREDRDRSAQGSLSDAIRSAQGRKSEAELRSCSPSKQSREARKPVEEKRGTDKETGQKRDRKGQGGSAKVESRGVTDGEKKKHSSPHRSRSSSPRQKSSHKELPKERANGTPERRSDEDSRVSKEVPGASRDAKSRQKEPRANLGGAECRKMDVADVGRGGDRAERGHRAREGEGGERRTRGVESEPRRKEPPLQRENVGADHRPPPRDFRNKGAVSRMRLVKREVAGRIVFDDDEMPSREREKTRRDDGGREEERAIVRRERTGARASSEIASSRRDRDPRNVTDRGDGGRHEGSQQIAERRGKEIARSRSGKDEGLRTSGTAVVLERRRVAHDERPGLQRGGSGGKDKGRSPANALKSDRRENSHYRVPQNCDREKGSASAQERREKPSLAGKAFFAGRDEKRTVTDTRAGAEPALPPFFGVQHSSLPPASPPSSFTLFGNLIRPPAEPDNRGSLRQEPGARRKERILRGDGQSLPYQINNQRVGAELGQDLGLGLAADARHTLPLFEEKPTEPLRMSNPSHQAVRDFGTTFSPRWPSSEALVRAGRTDSKATQTYAEDFLASFLARRLDALETIPLYRECFTDLPTKDPARAHWATDFRLNLEFSCGQSGVASKALEDKHRADSGSWTDDAFQHMEGGNSVRGSGTVRPRTESSAGRGDDDRQFQPRFRVPNGGQPDGRGSKRAHEPLGTHEDEDQPRKLPRIKEDPSADGRQHEVPPGTVSAEAPFAVPFSDHLGYADEGAKQSVRSGTEESEDERYDDTDGFWDPSPRPGEDRSFTQVQKGRDSHKHGISGRVPSLWKSPGLAEYNSFVDEDIPLKVVAAKRARAKQMAVKGSALKKKPELSLETKTAVQKAVADGIDLTVSGSKEHMEAAVLSRRGQESALGGVGAVSREPQCALCGVGPSLERGDWYCANCGRRDDTCTCDKPMRAHEKWKRKYAVKYRGPKAVVHKLCAFWTPSVYQPGDGEAFVGLKRAVIDSTGSPNNGGKKLTPVRCTFCNEIGATSRCRVESTCHSVYHYTCAVTVGCRLHDCLEDQGLSVACPNHFHVGLQIKKGTVVPCRLLPWTAVKEGVKRQKITSPRNEKPPAGKAVATMPARKSTILKTWKEPDEANEETQDLVAVTGVAEDGRGGGEPVARKRAVQLTDTLAMERGKPRRRSVEPFAEGPLSPGALSPLGKKSLGNRELRSILADVPKPKELPSEAEIEEQQRKKREKQLVSKQGTIQRQRAALLEELAPDAGLRALVRRWAPSVYRLMGKLQDGTGNGAAKLGEEKRKEGGNGVTERGESVRNGEPGDGKKARMQNGLNGRDSRGERESGNVCRGDVDGTQEGGETLFETGMTPPTETDRVGERGRGGHRSCERRAQSEENGCPETETDDAEGDPGQDCGGRTPDSDVLLNGSRPGDEETEPGRDGIESQAGDESTGTAGTDLVQPVEFDFDYDSDGQTAQLAKADEERKVKGCDSEVVGEGVPGSVDVSTGGKEDKKADVLQGLVNDEVFLGRETDDSQATAEQGLSDELVFECVACGETGASSDMEQHPALPAILCGDCLESFNSADFSDRCGGGIERHCQVCGRREKQRPKCDVCCKTICQGCLGRVLGSEQHAAIKHLDEWRCFACDLTQLDGLAEEVDRLRSARTERKGSVVLERRTKRDVAALANGADRGRVGRLRLMESDGQVRLNGVKGDDTGFGVLGSESEPGEGSDRAMKSCDEGLKPAPERPATSLSVLLPEDVMSGPALQRLPRTSSPDSAEGYACTWGGCSSVFSSPRARNGHMSKHARPRPRGGGSSDRDLSAGERGRGPSKEREELGQALQGKLPREELTEASADALLEAAGSGLRGGFDRAIDGAEGRDIAGGLVGSEEAEGESEGEDWGAGTCAACGASLGVGARQHPGLPIGVCKECEERYKAADFTSKDVRGWERACQLCGREACAPERTQCDGPDCRHSTCASCIGRVLRNKSVYLSDDIPWLCFACDVDRVEDAYMADGGASRRRQLEAVTPTESGGRGSEPDENAENGDKGGVKRREKSPKKKGAALGKRSHEASALQALSENWGFCQCSRCADRYNGKKDAQSPGAKPPSLALPSPRKSGSCPWAAFSRVGSRLVHTDLSGGKESVPIPFTNDVDDDVSALDMDYITELRLHPDLADFHERFDPAAGCSGCCTSAADNPDAPLNKHVRDLALFEGYSLRTRDDDTRVDWQGERMHGRLFYDHNGLLQLPPDAHPTIIECNSRCPCWPHCPNATLQRGASVHVEVFKTDDGRGFGVRTREDIQRGRLIGQYVGEVITSDEANRRNSVYLFNMDHHVRSVDEHDEVYVIDGGPASSVIRYINHSCDPNLAVYSVYTDTLHPGKPLLALYAIKDIVAGAELAYDYKYGDPGQAESDSKIECRCGAANCQLWLPDPTGIKSESQD